MVTEKKAALSPAQLGALAGGGMVEVDDGSRRSVRLHIRSDASEVWTRIATDSDGNEYTVLEFPDAVFDDVLSQFGAEEGQDQVKVGEMIWMRRT